MLFFVNQLFINLIKVVNANCIKCLSNSIKDFGKQLAYFTIFRNHEYTGLNFAKDYS
jgi:hypothetical protein